MSSQERCPHCRANVGVVPARRGGLRCRICGGPRVVIRDRRMVLSGNEAPHLVEARRRSRAAWLWLGLGVMAGVIGSAFLLLVTIGLLVFGASPVTSAIFLLFGSLPWVAAFWAWRRRKLALREAEGEVRRAQLSAARDVLGGSTRDLTAQDMARYLDLPLAPTERLLAMLNVDDTIVSEVTEAGDVTYRLAPLRVRVEEAYVRSRIAAELDDAAEPQEEGRHLEDTEGHDEAPRQHRARRAPDDGASR